MRTVNIRAAGSIALLMLCLAGASGADAAYIVNIGQNGNNVVATGSGSLNTDGLAVGNAGGTLQKASIAANDAFLAFNSCSTSCRPSFDFTAYALSPSAGPGSLGGGTTVFASASTGSLVYLIMFTRPESWLAVPAGYASGASLGVSTDTWDNTTIAKMGLTAGTYVWNWGSGATADSFTINISPTQTPEPSSLTLLGVAAVGLGSVMAARRKNPA